MYRTQFTVGLRLVWLARLTDGLKFFEKTLPRPLSPSYAAATVVFR